MEATATIITTPPSNKIKSASRLAQMATNNAETCSEAESHEIPNFQVEYAPSSSPPKRRKTPLSSSIPSKLSVTKTRGCLPMRELLLNLSPSPVMKCKTRLLDRHICSSPRNMRRSRRRIEMEEREFVVLDEFVKPRKRKNSGKSKKEKSNSVTSALPSMENDGAESVLDRFCSMIWELVMWRDVAKSSLWFGFGCLSFLSSCFSKGLNISLFSVISQLGLLLLAVSFISNTLHQGKNVPKTRDLCLKEDDILRVIRVVLPALNLAISKTRELFSGKPSMTLKVALFFWVGAEYGHFLTLWRLCVLGFFTSFTAPKLYSSYAAQIDSKVDQFKSRVLGAWEACNHKKIVTTSMGTIFWNMSSLKTRVFAAFISLVILRYYRQHSDSKMEEGILPREENAKLQKNMTVTEEEANETKQALVVGDEKTDK